jgi:porphobilinogen synthase
MSASFPSSRPRRLRRTPALRRLAAQVHLHPADLVLPVFVREGIGEPVPVRSMPGVMQHTMETLRKAAVEAVEAGVTTFAVFGVPATKDAVGSAGLDPDGILNLALRTLRSELGGAAVLVGDLCLDEFTDHGHCGVLAPDGSVDNDATLAVYADMALAQAAAGADLVGPSGMMDGQVGAIRSALDEGGYADVGIMAYSVKYASGFFGPFREAVQSSLVGDRMSYQQDPARAVGEAVREAALDVAEGADMVMVKPAMAYLDVVRAVADTVDVPVAAYQVSGEYSMVEAAAAQGWIDRERVITETLTSIKRAGADTILTYWAVEVAQRLNHPG